jgi:Anti-sigma regulatory factor (Ser/Thr protein kinase)
MPDVKFCLVFQRETLSVPVMRRVLGDTLRGLGVDEESVYDILLAATEACTNVLTHGGRKVRGYAVVTSLGAVGCQVEVADEGTGLAQARGFPPGAARRRLSPIRGRRQSPSCQNRAAAWPSCGPAWTTSRWTAVPAAARS